MMRGIWVGAVLTAGLCGLGWGDAVSVENEFFRVSVDRASGVLTSFQIVEPACELVEEKRLASNFRICLPLPDYQCNYIDGATQTAASVEQVDNSIEVRYSGLRSEKGEFPVELTYRIVLDGDSVRFRARLTNGSEFPVSEFWFPRLGGWKRFVNRDAGLAIPGYMGCSHSASLFKYFPGGRGLGSEAAEFSTGYPGKVMPWWDLYDPGTDTGLYLGYHDETFRLSTWHSYLFPNAAGHPGDAWMTEEEAAGQPVGMVFSHVRYPYIKDGETLDSGEFVVRLHRGDWHAGAQFYRKWFMERFPFDKSNSWLRKQSAWFTSIIYQPEDRVIADYETYDRWCKEAQEYGINCFELIGWDKGGLERDYPQYVPEEKLGGREGFKKLLSSIESRGGKCLVFTNYNILDSCTDYYKNELVPLTHQDGFGKTPNWMAWGESTLSARIGLNVRRHVLGSVVPPLQAILEQHHVDRVKDGADGFQIDKVVVGSALDFNPLNTEKPDVASCEGLVRGIAQLLEKCRAENPGICLASEASQDRLIPYVDVYYRSCGGFDIAPLRNVFPEWTACQHVAGPYEFNGVNAAAVTGGVICVEPDSYQGSLGQPMYRKLAEYIREVERIRKELADTVFLGNYHDTIGATVTEVSENAAPNGPRYSPAPSGALRFKVHGHRVTDRRAIVVANTSREERRYLWDFLRGRVAKAELYEPFQPVRVVNAGEPLSIKGEGLQILVEQAEELPANLCLQVKCGLPPNEVAFAKDGFGVRFPEGFTSAWGPYWLPPVYHCRASEKDVRLDVTVPKGAVGTLRLFVIDPDRLGGGRKQEVAVEGQPMETVEGFAEGRWLEFAVPETVTGDGKVEVRVTNLVPGGNGVVSVVEWRGSSH